MDVSYWKKRWLDGQTGWHENEVHPLLIKYYDFLSLSLKKHFFFPLCGKTLDLDWILSKNHTTTGVEASEIAIKEVENRLKVSFKKAAYQNFTKHTFGNLTLMQGNYFDLDTTLIDPIDVVFDRGAFVAIHPNQRKKYIEMYNKLLTHESIILLVAYQYNENASTNPPYSLSELQIRALMEPDFDIEICESEEILDIDPKFKERGINVFARNVYKIQKK